MKKKALIIVGVFIVFFIVYKGVKRVNFNSNYEVGQPLDSLNNVKVYFNGGVDNVAERNTVDGYNLGLKYQCVEFVKRYYFEHYKHKMPDSYGHAVSFFDAKVKDGEINTQRGLTQYTNPSMSQPQVGDLVVMDGSLTNKYGHIAIISNVTESEIEIIQQNPGPFASSRVTIDISKTEDGKWKVEKDRVLGWLRITNS